ncbi:hypothetical protein COLO4_08920 [Corchorus olitorius]|uniref:Uncharacterized protein n=1 Tax=Corchorus olitorius TaxID=93759 RepID=A0A1R3KE84_9ROSI|nr:hypothetical protein COLO4_08920 [Corchorus olitorius]
MGMGRVYGPNRLPPKQPTLVGSCLRGGSEMSHGTELTDVSRFL